MKLKRFIVVVTAIAILVMGTTAYAIQDTKTWSSESCRHNFITSAYIYTYSHWIDFEVNLDSCRHTPDNSTSNYNRGANFTPVNSSYQALGNSKRILPGQNDNWTTSNWGGGAVYLKVANPNYNTSTPTTMASSGSFIGSSGIPSTGDK